jgi:hypothetical protein
MDGSIVQIIVLQCILAQGCKMSNSYTGQAIFLDMVPGIGEKRNCFKMRVLKKGVRD